MTAEIRVASSPGEARVAVVVDGVLRDFALWRPGSPDGVGDIHRGRIVHHSSAMAGAFVALAGAEGFLPDSEGAKGLPEGTILPVRVTRSSQGGKGPRLSAREIGEVPAGGGVELVRRGPDAVSRFAALWPDAAIVVDDPGVTLGPPDRVRRVDRAGFGDSLLSQIECLGESTVTLDSGVRISVHPTPALVAIDVDSAGALSGRGRDHAAINRALIPELARQIRLRNLSGAILIDFAGMPTRKRASLGPTLAGALASDPLRPRLLGFTALGLAEIVRPRVQPPLHELLVGPLAAGLTALRHALTRMLDRPGQAPVLRAAPAVVAALEADRVALIALRERAGLAVILRADPSLSGSAWCLDE